VLGVFDHGQQLLYSRATAELCRGTVRAKPIVSSIKSQANLWLMLGRIKTNGAETRKSTSPPDPGDCIPPCWIVNGWSPLEAHATLMDGVSQKHIQNCAKLKARLHSVTEQIMTNSRAGGVAQLKSGAYIQP
jgi:hypothetical protein